MVEPVRESLDKVDEQIQELERERGRPTASCTSSWSALSATQDRLRDETGSLASALRAPAVRGRWGEIQLRRVVELAGMLEHCDFDEQVTSTGRGRAAAPRLVVRLPGGRHVVVDAKVPLEAYLEALEAADEETRAAKLRQHAAQVRAHVTKLAAKSYWAEFDGAPEFVVMFLPGESLYSARAGADAGADRGGLRARVLVATPTTLIGLLHTVHSGWREERLAENAQRISEEGRRLHERVATLLEHWPTRQRAGPVGEALQRALRRSRGACRVGAAPRGAGREGEEGAAGAGGASSVRAATPARPSDPSRPAACRSSRS